MKASELIDYLSEVINTAGDCEVLLWNPVQMKHTPINDVHFYTINDLSESLIDDKEFMEDFNYILENIAIL